MDKLYKIKPLEWEDNKAKTDVAHYEITTSGPGTMWKCWRNSYFIGETVYKNQAKQLCEEEYERRVKECLIEVSSQSKEGE